MITYQQRQKDFSSSSLKFYGPGEGQGKPVAHQTNHHCLLYILNTPASNKQTIYMTMDSVQYCMFKCWMLNNLNYRASKKTIF